MIVNTPVQHRGKQLETAGVNFLRYSLVLILVAFGAQKWTAAEALGIESWIQHSPLLSWLYHVLSVQHASEFLGVFEIASAMLIALRYWRPRLSAVGSALGVVMFLTTLSFLFTTPGQDQASQGFLLKDAFLLGTALLTAGEALAASSEA